MALLNLDGVDLYYFVKGKGVSIVFVHPPLITSEIFKYQLEELSHKNKVITFDIRGHGKSEFSHQPVTYPLIAEDIMQLLDHLEVKKAYLAGYSTGGTVVLEFMLRYPDRSFGGIAISGMSEIDDWYTKQRISLAAELAKEKTLPLLSLAISWGNSDIMDTFNNLHEEALKDDAKNIEQYLHYSLQYNCTDELKQIVQPVLLVYGSKNISFQHYAHVLHEQLPNNELIYLEKEKHQLPTKASAELNQLIDLFIQSHHAGSAIPK